MKNAYVKNSLYAAIISLLLLFQQLPNGLSANFIIMILTIWACLLFFAYFDEQRRQNERKIADQLRANPQVIPVILQETALSRQDIIRLQTTPRHFNYQTLKHIQSLLDDTKENR